MTPSHVDDDKKSFNNRWPNAAGPGVPLKSSDFSNTHILYVHVGCPVSSTHESCNSKGVVSEIATVDKDLDGKQERIPGLESVLLIKNDTCSRVELLESGDSSRGGSLNTTVVEGLPQSLFCQMDCKEEVVVENVERFVECSLKEEGLEDVFQSDISCSECDDNVHVDATQEDINLELSCYESESETSSEDGALHVIHNKPVPCRAKASLPGEFLCFKFCNKVPSITEVVGVFAKKEIAKRTRFGPVEGVLCDDYALKPASGLKFIILNEDGSFKYIDVSNENLSNWMRYVRPARSSTEQNLYLSQWGDELFFTASKVIHPGDELCVGYGLSYASLRKLKVRRTSKDFLELSKGFETQSNDTNPSLGSKGDNRKWCCSHCLRCFRSATSLNIHVLTHAAADIETNSHSNVNFNSSSSEGSSKNVKNKVHNSFNVHECKVCSKRFRSSTAFARHVKTHSSKKAFECPLCVELFPNVLNLKSHIHSHLLDGFYTCTYCSKKFKEYKHVRKHIRSFHNGKKHQCMDCSKCFPTYDKLRMHQLCHSEHKEFLCADCGKQFKRKDKLSDHMKRMHCLKNERPEVGEKSEDISQKELSDYTLFVYKCHLCLLGFKRRGMLVNHMANRHPDIPPDSVPELNLPILKANKDYFCQYCDKIYKSSTKRKAHILKYHPGEELPLSNRQMNKSIGLPEQGSNGTFSQVVGSVKAEPHNCSWCHKQYASKAKLLQHQRKKHPNLLPKTMQQPRKNTSKLKDDAEIDHCDAVGKIGDGEILLHESLQNEISVQEYELSFGDGHSFTEGEFIIDAATLKKALKGEVTPGEATPESLSEIGHLIEARPDQYFRVIQTSSGVSFARPVEIWDPLSSCQNLSQNDLDDEQLLTPYSEG